MAKDSLRKNMKLLYGKRGFSLAELVVVMGIFMVVMMITASTFKTVANQAAQQSKSVETQIEGIIGLEILRADIEQAGFGLPWVFQTTTPPVTYTEADVTSSIPASFWPSGWSPKSFNDAPGNPPRAVLSGDTTFNKDSLNIGSKYLVIKSTGATTNNTSRKWTNLAYANGTKTIRTWGSSARDLSATDRVIVVKNLLNTTPPTRQLRASSSTVYSATFNLYSTLTYPHLDGDTFEIYGIDPSNALKMPFNRADFYVRRPSASEVPKDCADSAGVGILYKSTVNHSNAGLSLGTPLLDCVADMQVVYGLDTSGAGVVNSYTSDPLATAEEVRTQLREIRIYILAQEGSKDRLFSYPSETIMVGEVLNGVQRGRVFSLKDRIGATIYKNYRWKVYTIVVRPKNLGQ